MFFFQVFGFDAVVRKTPVTMHSWGIFLHPSKWTLETSTTPTTVAMKFQKAADLIKSQLIIWGRPWNGLLFLSCYGECVYLKKISVQFLVLSHFLICFWNVFFCSNTTQRNRNRSPNLLSKITPREFMRNCIFFNFNYPSFIIVGRKKLPIFLFKANLLSWCFLNVFLNRNVISGSPRPMTPIEPKISFVKPDS